MISAYRYFNDVIGSELPLPDLPGADPGQGHRVLITQLSAEPARTPSQLLYESRLPGGLFTLAIHRRKEGYWIHFPGLADVFVDPLAGRISARQQPGLPVATLRHLLLDQVLPRVFSHTHALVLHGSTVLIGDRAVIFLGESGSGKSTLAYSFGQDGFAILGDDSVLVDLSGSDGPRVAASYAGCRLRADAVQALGLESSFTEPMAHYSSKLRLRPGQRDSSEPSPKLAAVFCLAPIGRGESDGRTEMTRLTGGEAAIALVRNCFALDIRDSGRLKARLADATRVAAAVPLARLTYRQDFASLRPTRQAILRAIDSR